MSFLGLGASAADAYDDDDSSTSVIHQDSDDDNNQNDPIQDDDVDIGFRRHQYETFEGQKRRRKSRQEAKDDALYGVFMEDSSKSQTRETPGAAPVFVAASTPDKKSMDEPPVFVKPTTTTATEEESRSGKIEESIDKALYNETLVEPLHKPPSSSSEPADDTPPVEEETKEGEQIKAKQKAADEYFQSLLQQAQDKKRRKRPRSPDPSTNAAAATMTSMPPPGMIPSAFGGSGIESTIAHKKDPTIATWEKHEKGIGSRLLFKMGWKGSGGLGSNRRKFQSKTTADTGASTDSVASAAAQASAIPSSISSQQHQQQEELKAKKGISRPVEVVVRPSNLGLGFGNFKEMSKLKSNLEIEAEVRGIELPKKKRKKGVLDIMEGREEHGHSDDDNDEVYDASKATAASSAIPTTQELMTQKAWKRRKTKRAAPKIIPYQELVAQQEQKTQDSGELVIIDMRGPSAASAGTGTATAKDTGKVPLGEELLHNVTFMLNTHENQLHSHSQIIKSTERKETSLQSEISDLQRQQQEARERRVKLEKALRVVQTVENLAQESPNGNDQLKQVIQWIEDLGDSFSEEDRTALRYWQSLAPALLSPILQVKLEQWDPLGPIKHTKELLDSLFDIKANTTSEKDKQALHDLRYSVLHGHLLPRIQQVLESSRWDPTVQTDIVIDMYECLLSKVQKTSNDNKGKLERCEDQVLPGGPPDADHADDKHSGTELGEVFRKELVLGTIYPKLQTTLSRWKPSFCTNGKRVRLEKRLDWWILPWMPHLDHPAILSNLLSDCRRKLKSSMSYMQRKIGKDDDLEFVRAARDTLKPWVRVFDRKVLQRLVSEYVTPYLGRALAKVKVHRDTTEQKLESIQTTMELHDLGLLSDIEFLSVLEAELLPRWASRINDMLVNKSASVEEAAALYCSWKKQVMGKFDSTSERRSSTLLREDSRICAIFYSVLRMIHLAGKTESMDELDDLHPPSTNYHVASARRTKEMQSQVEDEFVRMEARSAPEFKARIRLRRRQVDNPSFRDVVEEFANERGILFQPRMGAKALKDGKQVFLFGEVPIYIEGDVIYASRGGSWRPTSLNQLIESSAS